MSTLQTHILKFGGSSLQSSLLIQQSVNIVAERMETARPIVVVSAIGGVTDMLLELADHIIEDKQTSVDQIQKLEDKHQGLLTELTSADHNGHQKLKELFSELQTTVQDSSLQEQNQRAWKDRILSIGERASALIFAAVLSKGDVAADPFEAHHFIKTDSTFGQAKVKTSLTRELVREYLESTSSVPVITGFIGSNAEQQITTLGRSGSDYSASLIADAMDADHLEIWTDVNGVLTADPRWVPTAQPIEQLSFADITELSAHGAKVIHPQTIRPIQDKDTSVLVKNTYNPVHPGTLITSGFNSNGALKTITIAGPFVQMQVDEQHTLNLLSKLNEWLDGQPNLETIGFHRSSEFEPARFILQKSFFERISDQLATWSTTNNVVLDLESDLYKVKKFSNHFGKSEGLTKRIWNLLAANDLRPINADRNRDERFISFLFKKDDAQLAARLLNDYLQGDDIVVDLFVAGTGAVGQTLLEKFKHVAPDGIQFRLLGVCNSRNTLWDDHGLNLTSNLDWSEAEDTNWELLTNRLTQTNHHNLVFVDATGSEQVARLYPELLKNSIHIVTPSKLANSFEQSFFDKLQSLTQQHNTSFRYETTVGASLPVLSTLENLMSSGDTIAEISGVVSGTMTYLFNQLEKGVPFSKVIVDAREQGYAEPDPRDDLSGEDVARKFLTLARTIGLKIERDDLEVESLIPEDLRDVDRTTFLQNLHEYNDEWDRRIKQALERDETLRYTGRLADGKISIGIQSVPQDSPLGQLKGTDNLIQIFSDLYQPTPLVIQGAGAGKEVTAAGVLSDILTTVKSLS